MISPYHENISKHYEKYPYPSYPLWGFGSWSQLSSVDLKNWGIVGGVQTAWIVGCGTIAPMMFGRRNPEVSFFASDFSKSVLRTLKLRLFLFGIRNVKTIHEDLVESRYVEAFDAIDCYGVLHHTFSPGIAFEKLVRALRPGGVLRLMVYRREVRAEIERLRSEIVEKGIKDLRDVKNFLQEQKISATGDLSNPAGIADALLNPIVHTFDEEALQNLLKTQPQMKILKKESVGNWVVLLSKEVNVAAETESAAFSALKSPKLFN